MRRLKIFNNTFDKPIRSVKDDILDIHFPNYNGYTSTEYQFKFTGKSWKNIPLDHMSIYMNDEKSFGKVQNGIKMK